MKRNDTVMGKILADKRRGKIALAVFAPLLAAVVVLTGILSLLPAMTAEVPLPGPFGDVIYNIPYTYKPPETVNDLGWTFDTMELSGHSGYDRGG